MIPYFEHSMIMPCKNHFVSNSESIKTEKQLKLLSQTCLLLIFLWPTHPTLYMYYILLGDIDIDMYISPSRI